MHRRLGKPCNSDIRWYKCTFDGIFSPRRRKDANYGHLDKKHTNRWRRQQNRRITQSEETETETETETGTETSMKTIYTPAEAALWKKAVQCTHCSSILRIEEKDLVHWSWAARNETEDRFVFLCAGCKACGNISNLPYSVQKRIYRASRPEPMPLLFESKVFANDTEVNLAIEAMKCEVEQ